jgi:hypothetical protein
MLASGGGLSARHGKVEEGSPLHRQAATAGVDQTLVQHVALNIRMNCINTIAETEIDFPRVAARKAA